MKYYKNPYLNFYIPFFKNPKYQGKPASYVTTVAAEQWSKMSEKDKACYSMRGIKRNKSKRYASSLSSVEEHDNPRAAKSKSKTAKRNNIMKQKGKVKKSKRYASSLSSVEEHDNLRAAKSKSKTKTAKRNNIMKQKGKVKKSKRYASSLSSVEEHDNLRAAKSKSKTKTAKRNQSNMSDTSDSIVLQTPPKSKSSKPNRVKSSRRVLSSVSSTLSENSHHRPDTPLPSYCLDNIYELSTLKSKSKRRKNSGSVKRKLSFDGDVEKTSKRMKMEGKGEEKC